MFHIDACFALSSMSMQEKSGRLVFLDSRVNCLFQYANGVSGILSHAKGSCSSLIAKKEVRSLVIQVDTTKLGNPHTPLEKSGTIHIFRE